MQTEQKIRRFLVLGLVIVVAIPLCFYAYHLLTTGKISIKTNQPAGYIKLSSGAGGTNTMKSTQGQKLNARLKPGTYTVLASTSTAYTSQVIHLDARKHISLSINLKQPGSPEPVASKSALGLGVASGALYYIDSATGNLRQINSEGDIATISTANFKKARWTNSGTGLLIDAGSNLYTFNNGSLTALALPFTTNNNPSIDFDISPDGDVYVSNGQAVFNKTPSGDFKQIYSSGNGYNVGLRASDSAVSFIEKNSDGQTSVVVVSRDGSVKRTRADADSLAWSSDGTRLAALSSSGSGSIYDSSLANPVPLPNTKATNPTWVGQDLLYSVGNIFWRYSLANHQAQAIVRLPANQSIKASSLSPDQKYLYFSTGSSLMRITPQGRTSSNSLSALNAFLPENVGVCSLDYTNFIKPTITVQFPALETSAEICLNLAKRQVSYFGLDTNTFQFKISSTPVNPITNTD